MKRKEFLASLASMAATPIVGSGTALADAATGQSTDAPTHKVKRGVSLYSYQWAMMERGWEIEDCLEEAGDIGAYGIEIMLHAMKSQYPNVSTRWIDNWWRMMDDHGTVPVCYTAFGDFYRQREGLMPLDDCVDYMAWNFKIAKQLGLMKVRGFGRHDALERLIPIAEKMGLWMGMEIHSPATLKGNKLLDYVHGLADKHPHVVGFVPDMGIFQKYPRPLYRELQIREGALTRDIAAHIEDSYRQGMDRAEVADQVERMNPMPGDTAYVETVYQAGAALRDPKDLIPIMPYCRHVHGKTWEMTPGDRFEDACIIYDEVVPVLMEHGYDGYICTEFEGQRMGTVVDVDEIDQVRRQHVMLKRMLGV